MRPSPPPGTPEPKIGSGPLSYPSHKSGPDSDTPVLLHSDPPTLRTLSPALPVSTLQSTRPQSQLIMTSEAPDSSTLWDLLSLFVTVGVIGAAVYGGKLALDAVNSSVA